jgi:hypothetical protein
MFATHEEVKQSVISGHLDTIHMEKMKNTKGF